MFQKMRVELKYEKKIKYYQPTFTFAMLTEIIYQLIVVNLFVMFGIFI